VLKTLPDCSVDAVVTDPPAGIGFMGKEWDDFRRQRNPADAGRDNAFGRTSKTGPEYGRCSRANFVDFLASVMRECLRVLKPGGHALVWSIPRTSHWTAWAIEDAGFEVRDCVLHLFGTGFPKNLDVSKAIDKAAGAEREVLGIEDTRSKFDGRERASEAINTNWRAAEGRTDVRNLAAKEITAPATDAAKQWEGWGTALKPAAEYWWLARKPLEGTVAANVMEHGTGALNIDGCRIPTDDGKPHYSYPNGPGGNGFHGGVGRAADGSRVGEAVEASTLGRWPANVVTDGSEEVLAHFPAATKPGKQPKTDRGSTSFSAKPGVRRAATGDVSRFFYAAKPSKAERGEGNVHPTVKSIALMRYLCRLVTPPGGVVLDCFAGSGTTLLAAREEGFRAIGIEREQAYIDIINQRLGQQ
jgi:site-specific DNA-methyltransferase (adenine-specific)